MNLTLITHLVAAGVAAAAAWVFQDARMDAAVADVRLEQSNAEVRSAPTTAANARSARKNQNAANGVPPSAPNLAQREPLVRSEHRVPSVNLVKRLL